MEFLSIHHKFVFLKKIHEPYILFFDFSLGALCHCIRLACKLLWSDLVLCKFINELHFNCILSSTWNQCFLTLDHQRPGLLSFSFIQLVRNSTQCYLIELLKPQLWLENLNARIFNEMFWIQNCFEIDRDTSVSKVLAGG